ncbi:hypothetical protein MMC14_006709 [Varicellaria rhodocarpa]|nr:hypothetical protein [Varicellaria rhodocarpa]
MPDCRYKVTDKITASTSGCLEHYKEEHPAIDINKDYGNMTDKQGQLDTPKPKKESASASPLPAARRGRPSVPRPGCLQEFDLTVSIGGMTCTACTVTLNERMRALVYVKSVEVHLMTLSADVRFSAPASRSNTIIEIIKDTGYEASIIACTPVHPEATTTNPLAMGPDWQAILSIGGMTCATCTNGITDKLRDLDFVKDINVVLMNNSGYVTFEGLEHLDEIVERIEGGGHDCSVESVENVLERQNQSQSPRRKVELSITGVHCDPNPTQIMEALNAKYPGLVEMVRTPTPKDHILGLSYEPNAPSFTIRDIIATVRSVHESCETVIHHLPSVEETSKAMQIKERKLVLHRLMICSLIAIPTFLIGILWMSLVSGSNSNRQYFEETLGGGNVTRAELSLLILAGLVMFICADIFHMRAIKEIRALWGKRSKVPILRRFYRFGSMNLLISAGTLVAFLASCALLVMGALTEKHTGEHTTYFDSVVFLTLFILIGRYLEAYSKSKSGDAVEMLGKLRPQEATLVPQPSLEKSDSASHTTETNLILSGIKIHADMLDAGDTVTVAKGSSPPADGIILSGFAQFDESSLTGESRSVAKGPGEQVFAGTVNTGNSITVEITAIGGDSMLDKIVKVVREGQSKRAPLERLADVLTGYFVPMITAIAIMTFFVWFALGQSGFLDERYMDGQAGGWAFWSLEFAIAVFVVACPCGIGLAAPTALFVGSGLAAKHGVLVRGGGEAFQEAGDLDIIVFDKTGTLTEGGDLKVTEYEMHIKDAEEVKVAWSIARSLEEQSSHPIAQAIVQISSQQTSTEIALDEISEAPGLGMRGLFTHGSVKYEAALGSESLISSLHPQFLDQTHSNTLSSWKSQGRSVAILAMRKFNATGTSDTERDIPWVLATLFGTSDPIRPSALPAIQNLQARGLAVYMLTGDNPQTALSVATDVGIPISNVFAGVLPIEKATKIEWLQEHGPRRKLSLPNTIWTTFLRYMVCSPHKQTHRNGQVKVAFIGDGVNDAPALTTATLSLSISTGSAIALSSSSFILMTPALTTIPVLLDLSTRVFRRIKFNFVWALMYNVLLIPVAAGIFFSLSRDGWRLGPVWASAAMAASSVSVVCSSLMLRWEGGWMFWKIKRSQEDTLKESEEVEGVGA